MDHFRQFGSGHFGHGEVRENEIDLHSICNKPKGVPSRCRGNRLVSDSNEHSQSGSEDDLIIVNEEDDRLRLGPQIRLGINQFFSAIFWDILEARQEDLHRGALADPRVDYYASA